MSELLKGEYIEEEKFLEEKRKNRKGKGGKINE